MAQRKTLTQRQIDVLRWIGDGCPDGVMVEDGHPERISTAALRSRGLITTKGSGAKWSAAITTAGTEYLARVDGPNPPVPRGPNTPASQQLIDDILAAGGTLRVPRPYGYRLPGEPDYERRAALAEQRGTVPSGKRLVITHERDELRIDLRDTPEGTPTETLPVLVPDRVGRYHRVVAEFRDRTDRHEISRAQVPRICRILQGLVVEAERRGFTVHGPATSTSRRQGMPEWSGDVDGHLRITVGDVDVTLRVREDGMPKRAIYPRGDYRYRAHDQPARRSTAYEQSAKGTVRISVLAPYSRSNRQSSWGDGKIQTLEECLPAVLREVQTRAAEQRERLKIEQDEAERRRLAWEEAKTQARQRHAEHHRATILTTQVDAWQRATAIRAYCDAIEQQRPDDFEAARWSEWARAHADAIDPLGQPLALPEPPPDPSADDLRPFLDGWSPYEPKRLPRYQR